MMISDKNASTPYDLEIPLSCTDLSNPTGPITVKTNDDLTVITGDGNGGYTLQWLDDNGDTQFVEGLEYDGRDPVEGNSSLKKDGVEYEIFDDGSVFVH